MLALYFMKNCKKQYAPWQNTIFTRSDATPIKICKLNNHQNLNESSDNNWSLIFVWQSASLPKSRCGENFQIFVNISTTNYKTILKNFCRTGFLVDCCTKKLKLEVLGSKRSFTFSYFFPPLIMSSNRRFITFYSVGVPFAQP